MATKTLKSSDNTKFGIVKQEKGCCSQGIPRLMIHLQKLPVTDRKRHLQENKSYLYFNIHNACRQGHSDLLQLLLEPFSEDEKFDLLSKEDTNGNYPLHNVLCISTDINPNTRLKMVNLILRALPCDKKYKYLKYTNTLMNQTALHLAAQLKDLEVAKVAFHEILPNLRKDLARIQDKNQKSFLHYCERFKTFLTSGAISEICIEERTEPENNTCERTKAGLYTKQVSGTNAQNLQYLDSTKYITANEEYEVAGLNSNKRDRDDVKHKIQRNESLEITRSHPHLLTPADSDETQANDTLAGKYKETLISATNNDNLAVTTSDLTIDLTNFNNILELVFQFSDLSLLCEKLIDAEKRTLLHLSAQGNRLDLVQKLLSFFPSFEQKWCLLSKVCSQGRTALHYAAMTGNIDVVKEILFNSEHNDVKLVEIKDKYKKTAAQYGDQRIECLLGYVRTHYWRTFYVKPTVLIFYNTYQHNATWHRAGAEEEMNAISEGFKSQGIQPMIMKDFSRDYLLNQIRTIQEMTELSALIVAVMSHGEEGVIYDISEDQVRIQEIVSAMSSTAKNFPKMLILQCCLDRYAEECRKPFYYAFRKYDLKSSDMCIICSTLNGTKSLRCYFISKLGKLLLNSNNVDIYEMFQKLSRKMEWQTPTFYGTLKKKLLLHNPMSSSSTVIRPLLEKLFGHKTSKS